MEIQVVQFFFFLFSFVFFFWLTIALQTNLVFKTFNPFSIRCSLDNFQFGFQENDFWNICLAFFSCVQFGNSFWFLFFCCANHRRLYLSCDFSNGIFLRGWMRGQNANDCNNWIYTNSISKNTISYNNTTRDVKLWKCKKKSKKKTRK